MLVVIGVPAGVVAFLIVHYEEYLDDMREKSTPAANFIIKCNIGFYCLFCFPCVLPGFYVDRQCVGGLCVLLTMGMPAVLGSKEKLGDLVGLGGGLAVFIPLFSC